MHNNNKKRTIRWRTKEVTLPVIMSLLTYFRPGKPGFTPDKIVEWNPTRIVYWTFYPSKF